MTFDDGKRTVYQALRLLNGEQLDTIIRRHNWIDVDIVGPDRDTKAKKIRDRAETHLIETDEPKEGDGNPDWTDFRKYIVDDIIDGGYGKDRDRIKNVLERTIIRPLNQQSNDEDDEQRAKKVEQWYSAQLYGALYDEFNTPDSNYSGLTPTSYNVYREHCRWGLNVDLFIENERTGNFHLIEVKRDETVNDFDEVEDQLKRYNAVFSDRDEMFLCLMYEKSKNISTLAESSYDDIDETEFSEVVEEIEDEIQTEIDNITVVASEIDPDP